MHLQNISPSRFVSSDVILIYRQQITSLDTYNYGKFRISFLNRAGKMAKIVKCLKCLPCYIRS